jgi:hypothetical protein
MAPYSAQIILGAVILLVVWVCILRLLCSKKPDPRMILLCSLWARWPK